LHDGKSVIGDGHLWIIDHGLLFRFFQVNRRISFSAKSQMYKKSGGQRSFELVKLHDIEIVYGVLGNADISCTG
jgi:hypothetical protein